MSVLLYMVVQNDVFSSHGRQYLWGCYSPNDNIKGHLFRRHQKCGPLKTWCLFPRWHPHRSVPVAFLEKEEAVVNNNVSSSSHYPSLSNSVVGVLAESLAATFQNNSVSSHFHCYDSPCCLWRWGQAPVSFMRVSPSSHINLVFLMPLPLLCFKRLPLCFLNIDPLL